MRTCFCLKNNYFPFKDDIQFLYLSGPTNPKKLGEIKNKSQRRKEKVFWMKTQNIIKESCSKANEVTW